MELPVKTVLYSHYPETGFVIKARNLSYRLSVQPSWVHWKWPMASCLSDCVLKNVNCEAKPGEVTAIAGPSGAGKTTLLEILSGSITRGEVTGEILINGGVMDAVLFRRISGYVTQDEALFPHLTVEETLLYMARLRMKDTGRDDAKARVEYLMKELGLEHLARVRVGSESNRAISGGEKRRVSIGVELVHNPEVLLLDEPTSGLDSASAFHVMLLLKKIAKNQGKTIVLTIHQPGFRILELLDKVILLSHGVVLHDGPLSLLEDRLNSSGHCIPQHVNALEYAIDVKECLHKEARDIESGEFVALESCDHQTLNHPGDGSHILHRNSNFKEVMILSERFSNNIFRTKQLFAAKTIEALLAGIVLGTIYTNAFGNTKIMKLQNQVGFFAFTLTLLMSSAMEALPIFLQERRIMMRETSRGVYRVSSYIISNVIVFLPFLLIVALLYSTTVYWLVGLRRDSYSFLYFTLVVWMVLAMANSFVACFSTVVPNFIAGLSLIYGIMGSFFLFSGYFISKDTIPKYWNFMPYLSLFKYPFECLVINEFGGEQGKLRCVEGNEVACFINGSDFLKHQGLAESQKWTNFVIMLGFIIVYRFLGFLCLRFRCYRIMSTFPNKSLYRTSGSCTPAAS